MSGLIKVSMRDVIPSTRMGGSIHPLLTPLTVGATAGFLGTMRLEPGEFVATHYHPHSDEFLFVAQGVMTLRLADEIVVVEANEATMIPKHTPHRIENNGDAPTLLVFQMAPLAPSPEEGHVEVEAMPFPDAAPPVVGG
ncbi:cupin domain-containing protein [Amycolatopsis japonica]